MTFSSLFREVFAEEFLYFSFRTLREVSFSSSGLFFFVCEKREEKINAEEYIDDYKKIVPKTSGKTSYYSVVIWGSDTPDIMLKIYYYEQGERKETKVKMDVNVS